MSDFGLLKKKIEALIELRKILLREKLVVLQLGNYLTPRILIFCRFTGFTKMQLTSLRNPSWRNFKIKSGG